MEKIKIYCVTNKPVSFLNESKYNLAWVGKEESPENYLKCDTQDNIFYKEKY